jgi:3-phenylpropionate/cinnamic acid dioxygenase small subunit
VAIERLILTYAERLDAGDFDGVGALFARAVTGTPADPRQNVGAAATAAMIAGTVVLYDGSPCTKHVMSNISIDVAPDRLSASARTDFTVFQSRPDFRAQPVVAGVYRDTFARTDDGTWHFASRLYTDPLFGDVSRHMTWSPR